MIKQIKKMIYRRARTGPDCIRSRAGYTRQG